MRHHCLYLGMYHRLAVPATGKDVSGTCAPLLVYQTRISPAYALPMPTQAAPCCLPASAFCHLPCLHWASALPRHTAGMGSHSQHVVGKVWAGGGYAGWADRVGKPPLPRRDLALLQPRAPNTPRGNGACSGVNVRDGCGQDLPFHYHCHHLYSSHIQTLWVGTRFISRLPTSPKRTHQAELGLGRQLQHFSNATPRCHGQAPQRRVTRHERRRREREDALAHRR